MIMIYGNDKNKYIRQNISAYFDINLNPRNAC